MTISITQYDDKKEKSESFECLIDINRDFDWGFWYGENTEESVNDFKRGIEKWRKQLNKDIDAIDYDKLYKYTWDTSRTIHIDT